MNLKELRDLVGQKTKAGTRVSHFKTLHDAQKTDHNYFTLKYELGMSDEAKKVFRQMKLPVAKDLLDTFVSHLPISNPVVNVIAAKETKTYLDKAEKQAEFYNGLLQHSMGQADNFLVEGVKHMGARGEVFLKLVLDADALRQDEKDEDKVTEYYLERLPFKLEAREPMNCYPSDDHFDCHPADMIEKYTVKAGQIRRQYPEWKGKKADNQDIEVVEYWSPTQKAFLADDIPVSDGVEDNPLRFTPYAHIYSGLGMADGDNSPQSKAVGLIRFAHEIIQGLTRQHSYLDKASAFAAMPIIGLPGDREEYEEGGKKLTPHPGMVYYKREGERAEVTWAAPGMPAGIFNTIMYYESLLGKVQSEVLRGEAPKGVEAGYPMALLIGQARLLFGVPLLNYQVAVARALEMVRWLVRDVIKQSVGIWGKNRAITLKAGDCDGAFHVNVKFEAATPAGMMNESLGLQRLRQGGSISQMTELELNPLVKNPRKEINRIRVESLMKHPVLQRKAAVDAMKALYGAQEALLIEREMAEGEAGAVRKAESAGVPVGGRPETETPEDIIEQFVLGRRGRATRGGEGFEQGG